MLTDLTSLSGWLDKIADEIETETANLRKEMVIGIINRIAEATPVDTGLARSNWQASVGAPASGIRRPFSAIPSRWRAPYPQGGTRGERRNLLGATSAAQGALREYRDGDKVFITNNLPYIERLDDGYSPQSPAGFIRAGFAAGVALGRRNARFTLNGR